MFKWLTSSERVKVWRGSPCPRRSADTTLKGFAVVVESGSDKSVSESAEPAPLSTQGLQTAESEVRWESPKHSGCPLHRESGPGAAGPQGAELWGPTCLCSLRLYESVTRLQAAPDTAGVSRLFRPATKSTFNKNWTTRCLGDEPLGTGSVFTSWVSAVTWAGQWSTRQRAVALRIHTL